MKFILGCLLGASLVVTGILTSVSHPAKAGEYDNSKQDKPVNPGEGKKPGNPGEGKKPGNPGEGKKPGNPGEGKKSVNPGEGKSFSPR